MKNRWKLLGMSFIFSHYIFDIYIIYTCIEVWIKIVFIWGAVLVLSNFPNISHNALRSLNLNSSEMRVGFIVTVAQKCNTQNLNPVHKNFTEFCRYWVLGFAYWVLSVLGFVYWVLSVLGFVYWVLCTEFCVLSFVYIYCIYILITATFCNLKFSDCWLLFFRLLSVALIWKWNLDNEYRHLRCGYGKRWRK